MMGQLLLCDILNVALHITLHHS